MIVVSHDESYIVAVQRNTKCSGWVVDISECLLLAFAPFRSTKPGHPRPHLKAASIKGRKRRKFIIMICQSCSEGWKMFTVANAWKEVGVPGRIEITKLHFCTSGTFAFSPFDWGRVVHRNRLNIKLDFPFWVALCVTLNSTHVH